MGIRTALVLAGMVLAAAPGACGRVGYEADGKDRYAAGDGGGGDDDGDGDAAVGPPPNDAATACVDLPLGSVLGAPVVTGSTVGAGDEADGCAGQGAPDVFHAWTAPTTGRFRFATCGSSFDTTITIRDGACDGEVVRCSDNDGCGSFQDTATLDLLVGQTVIVIVDGWGGERGDYELSITEP